ncbi:hypothetical protein PFISCL1PPCAC_21987, partial [Pristionchus fissidentatus]
SMSVGCSDGTDNDSLLSSDSRNSLNYDARYLYRLQCASRQLANSEARFHRVKRPLLEHVDKHCVSLSMDLIATNNSVFSMRRDDLITLDNLVWTLGFYPFGFDGSHHMLELRVDSSLADDANWHTEAHVRVAFGGHVLSPLLKFHHPIRFCAQSPALVVFIVDALTVRSWPSGLVQVDVYPQSDEQSRGALFCNNDDPDDVPIHVQNGSSRRTFYVNRRWIEYHSDYVQHYINSEFAYGEAEVPIDNVAPRDFLILLRAMERFDEDEMLRPDKIEILLNMISKFQAGPLQQQMIPAFRATREIDNERKLLLADKYLLPWSVTESTLSLCCLQSLRASTAFDSYSFKLRQEIISRLNRYSDDTVSAPGSVKRGSYW